MCRDRETRLSTGPQDFWPLSQTKKPSPTESQSYSPMTIHGSSYRIVLGAGLETILGTSLQSNLKDQWMLSSKDKSTTEWIVGTFRFSRILQGTSHICYSSACSHKMA